MQTRLWICGRIDPKYDECLTGTVHIEEDNCGHTLCGRPARVRHGKTTAWWPDKYGSTNGATCDRCRKAAGMEPVSRSLITL